MNQIHLDIDKQGLQCESYGINRDNLSYDNVKYIEIYLIKLKSLT